MIEVTPMVYLLAETHINRYEMEQWLRDLKGSSILSTTTGSEPEILVELAARRCYKSFAPDLNPNVKKIRTDSQEYHENILKSAHGSVYEHATCTWAFEFVSRVFTHELVRNRIGNAFSQESLRYVRLTELGFCMPKVIADDPAAASIFTSAVEYLETCQRSLAKIFDIDNMKGFNDKKVLTSAFRRIAPIGLATGIVFSCNFRSLRWLIEQRSSLAAEAEMRAVIDQVASIAVKRWPYAFQDFTRNSDGEWIPKYRKV